jgi:hypothetical protein
MADIKIEWEDGVPEGVKKFTKKVVEALVDASQDAIDIIANESEQQVPLQYGTLRDSWEVLPLKNEIGFMIGYHTPYASRLHEHPEYNFRNGRKGKFLEDPIEQNLGDYQGKYIDKLRSILK